MSNLLLNLRFGVLALPGCQRQPLRHVAPQPCPSMAPQERSKLALVRGDAMTPDKVSSVSEERIERKAKQLGQANRDPNWWNYKDAAIEALRSSAPRTSPQDQ